MLLLLLALAYGVSAFSPRGVGSISYKTSALLSKNTGDDAKSRRIFLSTLSPLLASIYLPTANAASVPVQQAVGSAESKCREEGNCLEKGELDGGTCKKINIYIFEHIIMNIQCTHHNIINIFVENNEQSGL